MRKIMRRRTILLLSMTLVLSTTGCIKETYDMNTLSKEVHLSPAFAISAIKGDVSLSDMVKASDKVIFNENNSVKIVFKKDSVLDLKMADFYDLDNMLTYSQTFTLGDLSLDPFQYVNGFTLREISSNFSLPLQALFTIYDDGSPHPFPPFPSTDLGEKTFSFTNFENATFRSGFIDILVTNHLTAKLNSISVKVFNTSGHSPIGDEVIIPAIEPGETQTASINLADETVTNSVIAAIVLSGSPGNPDPVLIDLDNSNIQVTVRGRDLIVKSGRVIIPEQTITTSNNKDTITFDPGSGIELDKISIETGKLSYRFQSTCQLKGSFWVKLPTVLRSGNILTESIIVYPNSITSDSISVNNTIFNLGIDPEHPYNRVPMESSFEVNSEGLIVNFNSADEIQFDLNLPSPVFDYVKGYFGNQVETIALDSVDLDLKDILNHITGVFKISSPSIRLNYSNSFAIPVQISLNAEGLKKAETVNLGLAPFILTPPVFPPDREFSSSIVIDKNNSSLPELISMPPEKIRFSGSARMNPAGNNGLRDNYVFSDSHIHGSAEVEVPLEFQINNLAFTDTMNNYLADVFDNESEFNWDNFELFRIDFDVENGFPLGVSLKMDLRDSVSHQVTSIDATDLLKPAPVNSDGVAIGVTESSTSITFTQEFFRSINGADKIILKFTLNTTENGTKGIKIYSDYRINFKAALVLKPDIKLK
jgi:hypothetical protein